MVANAATMATARQIVAASPFAVWKRTLARAVTRSSMALLPNALNAGPTDVCRDAASMRACAYDERPCPLSLRATRSSHESSMSRLTQAYIAQTSGLNQNVHAASASRTFRALSNRATWTNSCSSTRADRVGSFQSKS